MSASNYGYGYGGYGANTYGQAAGAPQQPQQQPQQQGAQAGQNYYAYYNANTAAPRTAAPAAAAAGAPAAPGGYGYGAVPGATASRAPPPTPPSSAVGPSYHHQQQQQQQPPAHVPPPQQPRQPSMPGVASPNAGYQQPAPVPSAGPQSTAGYGGQPAPAPSAPYGYPAPPSGPTDARASARPSNTPLTGATTPLQPSYSGTIPPPLQQQQQPPPSQDPHNRSNLGGSQRPSTSQYARAPPSRTVDLASAPNPSRDIHYTDLPKEYATSTANPPLSTIDFIGVDDGNANPKFFRPTAGSAPAEDRLVKDSFLPFGAVISPLCQPLHPEEQVPVIRDRPPVRCHRCRGYISCHVRFTEMGRNWSCPLCGMSNAVEEQDFCNLDSKGRRLDRGERPELSRGSVEYDVDAFPEYSLKGDNNEICPTRPLHHLFLLDVSKQAMSSFLPDYVQAIREALQRMAEATPQCRVSFITFASQLHFYNFQHPELPQLCVPDIANPFVPLPFSNLCWLEVGFEMERIERFLDRVLTFAQDLNESDCALGAAVKAATLVLAGQHGGRVIMCANRHPQCGVGAITPREYQKTYGTEKDKELLRPIEGFWTTTATEAAKQQISFDAFLFPTEYCELVTISHLSHVTNGRVFLFPNYDPLIDNTKVQALMTQIATEEAGYAGILRVRCSSGLTVQRYRGHYLSQDVHDMDLANITGSSTFFVDFAHESKLEKNSYVHFQAALLYTTRGGSRRVRVHSYRIPVATTLSAFFGDADLEATLFGVIQETLMDAVNKGLKQARDGATDRLVKMLTCYRRYCTSDSNSTTLLMPSRLKLLPIFTLCLLKSDALAYGTTVRLDDRVQSIFDLVTMPIHKLIIYLYPSLFNAVNIVTDNKCGELHPVTQKCVLPRHRQLIFDSILKQGVYILCDEQARLVYMWIGPEVPAEASRVLFGGDDASQVGHAGGPGEEQFCDRLRNVLYALMLREDGMRRLIIVHSGERAEEAFFKQLKEEHDGAAMGHDEYLVLIHKAVNRALA